ncbi:MAG: sulfatase [Actinomycetota bacterium]
MRRRTLRASLRALVLTAAVSVALVPQSAVVQSLEAAQSLEVLQGANPAVIELDEATLAPARGSARRPNVILITSDDQAVSDLDYMPYTERLLARQGVTYDNFVSPHPLCCPARAEMISGQYGHNNGVHHNHGTWGGWQAFRRPRANVGAWMQAAGYNTGFTGKFLNGYEEAMDKVPGWTFFDPSVRNVYGPYDITLLNNYQPATYEGVYTADLVDIRTRAMIREFAALDRPFFIYSSQIAPHGMKVDRKWRPPVPAERHAKMFVHARPPSMRKPSYREANLSDKYSKYRVPTVKGDHMILRLHRQRIRSLQAVDESVRNIVRELGRVGELDNTVIIFTSDNGWLNGEHNYVGKTPPWEESLRIPMVVRGPGIPKNVHRRQTMTLLDLVPTMLELGRAKATVRLDGKSLLPTLRSARAKGYDSHLIQSGDTTTPWEYRGVRTDRYTYARFTDGFVELYDRERDPFQQRSVTDNPRYRPIQRELGRRTRILQKCAGPVCRTSFGPLPEPKPLPKPPAAERRKRPADRS